MRSHLGLQIYEFHFGEFILEPHLRDVTQVPQDFTHIQDHCYAMLPALSPESGGRELGGQDTGGSWYGKKKKKMIMFHVAVRSYVITWLWYFKCKFKFTS